MVTVWQQLFCGGFLVCFLTSTWRTEGRLSTGKSGRPSVDDSWEQRVVAMDSSWDTLDKGENKHNTQP